MIESEEEYLKEEAHLEQLRLNLLELKNNPASDMDNRFYELYVQTTEREIAEVEARLAAYKERQKQ